MSLYKLIAEAEKAEAGKNAEKKPAARAGWFPRRRAGQSLSLSALIAAEPEPKPAEAPRPDPLPAPTLAAEVGEKKEQPQENAPKPAQPEWATELGLSLSGLIVQAQQKLLTKKPPATLGHLSTLTAEPVARAARSSEPVELPTAKAPEEAAQEEEQAPGELSAAVAVANVVTGEQPVERKVEPAALTAEAPESIVLPAAEDPKEVAQTAEQTPVEAVPAVTLNDGRQEEIPPRKSEPVEPILSVALPVTAASEAVAAAQLTPPAPELVAHASGSPLSLNQLIAEAEHKGATAGRRPRRPAGFAMSLAIHAAVFALLTQTPLKPPPAIPNEYRQSIEGHEEKLVWYRFNQDLPEVTPPSAKKTKAPLKALNRGRQEIVASPAKAPERPQFVWTPAPKLPEITPLDLPNLIAVRLKPQPKQFLTPPDAARAPELKVQAPADAPQLEARALPPANLPSPQKPVKEFKEPPRQQAAKDAPKVEVVADVPQLVAMKLNEKSLPAPDRLVKQFIAPPKKTPEKLPDLTPAPEAPQLAASAARSDSAPLDFKFKAPARPFTPPSKTGAPSAGANGPRSAVTEGPPPVLAAGELLSDAKDLNLAVVGLHPTDKAPVLPAGASPAKFSAAPTIRKQGAETTGDGQGIAVPDLFVRRGKSAQPDLMAQVLAAPTSASNMEGAQKSIAGKAAIARVVELPDVPLTSRSNVPVKVANAPEPRFEGRDVFMMAIQMPNLTSYSGSWLMWYSDRTLRQTGPAPIAPPVPHRKVDPKYVASAQSDRIEGKVELACVIDREGRVSAIELVRGLDPRLNQAAQEALAKWEFLPALRDGVPVDVDVLVEIPFHLAPGKTVTY